MKPLVILNPRSGGGKTGRVEKELRETIVRSIGDVELVKTERGGHARELAKEGAEAGHPLVVAVGGDGTISEVTDGIIRSGKEAELGIIGQGTGGDFRKSLDIPHRLDAYLDRLKKRKTRTIDVGQLQYTDSSGTAHKTHFVNILSLGMGGLVDTYVADANRALGGTFAYFAASTKALLNIKLGKLKLSMVTPDGATEERTLDTFMLAICNGQYFGSGMHVAPMANLSDGTFDIVTFNATTKVAFAAHSRGVYGGTHVKDGHASHFKAQKLTVELVNDDAADVFLLDVDGEPHAGFPLEIQSLPSALRVCT